MTTTSSFRRAAETDALFSELGTFFIDKIIEIEQVVTTLDFVGSPLWDWFAALVAVLLVLVVVGGIVITVKLAFVVPARFVDNWFQSRQLQERRELDRIRQELLAIPNLPDDTRARLDALTPTDLSDCVK